MIFSGMQSSPKFSDKKYYRIVFFLGGYFYSIDDELTKDTAFQEICELGGGKGHFTRYYFLRGMSKILDYVWMIS